VAQGDGGGVADTVRDLIHRELGGAAQMLGLFDALPSDYLVGGASGAAADAALEGATGDVERFGELWDADRFSEVHARADLVLELP
jgi:hypothetical protein